MSSPLYCIDASALIELKDTYRQTTFKTLWENIGKLIADGVLISHKEVFKEITAGNDELVPWAKKHKEIFLPIDQQQEEALKKVLTKFPNFADELRSKPFADPWVVALAMARNATVVMMEKHANRGGRPRIPDVCDAFTVPHIELPEWFEALKWEF